MRRRTLCGVWGLYTLRAVWGVYTLCGVWGVYTVCAVWGVAIKKVGYQESRVSRKQTLRVGLRALSPVGISLSYETCLMSLSCET